MFNVEDLPDRAGPFTTNVETGSITPEIKMAAETAAILRGSIIISEFS
jgi:hypothetical protein